MSFDGLIKSWINFVNQPNFFFPVLTDQDFSIFYTKPIMFMGQYFFSISELFLKVQVETPKPKKKVEPGLKPEPRCLAHLYAH